MIDKIITITLAVGMWFGLLVIIRDCDSPKPVVPVSTKHIAKIDRTYPFYYPFIRGCSIHCNSKWRKV